MYLFEILLEKDLPSMVFSNHPTVCIFEEYCTDYSDDIMLILQEVELNSRLLMRYTSPQLQYRSILVNFIQTIGECKNLRRTTVHLAIYLMDAFMDNNNISDNRLELLSMCCILLASKLEENEPSVLSFKTVNDLLNCPCVLSDFAVLELMLLKFFKWQLLIPTTSVFVEFWMLNIVSKIDFPSNVSDGIFFERSARAVELVLEFLDVTLLDIKMTNIRPSLLASACIAAARSLLPVVKVWNYNMMAMTGYSYSEINILTRELLNYRACLVAESMNRKRRLQNAVYVENDDSFETDDENDFLVEKKRPKKE